MKIFIKIALVATLLSLFTGAKAQALNPEKVFLKIDVTPSGFAFLGNQYKLRLLYIDKGNETLLSVNKTFVNGIENGNETIGFVNNTHYTAPVNIPEVLLDFVNVSAEHIDNSGQKIIVTTPVHLMVRHIQFTYENIRYFNLPYAYNFYIKNSCSVNFYIDNNGAATQMTPLTGNGSQSLQFYNEMKGCTYSALEVEANKNPNINGLTFKLGLDKDGYTSIKNAIFNYKPGCEPGTKMVCPYMNPVIQEPYCPESIPNLPIQFSIAVPFWELSNDNTYKYKDFQGNDGSEDVSISIAFEQ